jgi:hypothetical protein
MHSKERKKNIISDKYNHKTIAWIEKEIKQKNITRPFDSH